MKQFLINIFKNTFPDYVFSEGSAFYRLFVKPILIVAREIFSIASIFWNERNEFSDSIMVGVSSLGIRPEKSFRGVVRLYFSGDGVPVIDKNDKFYSGNQVIIPLEPGFEFSILQDNRGKFIEVLAQSPGPVDKGEIKFETSFPFSYGEVVTPFVLSEDFTKEQAFDAIKKWGIDPIGITTILSSMGISDFALVRSGENDFSSDMIYGYQDVIDFNINDSFFGKSRSDVSVNPNAMYFINTDDPDPNKIIPGVMDLTIENELTDEQYRALWVNGDGDEWIIDLFGLFSFLTGVGPQVNTNFNIDGWIRSYHGFHWGDLGNAFIRGYYDENSRKWLVLGMKAFGVGDHNPSMTIEDIIAGISDDDYRHRMARFVRDIMNAMKMTVDDMVIERAINENKIEELISAIRRVL